MRLIDADKFFNDMYDMCNTRAQFVMDLGEIINVVDVLEQIVNTPTIDAVEVVRCEDCYYAEDDITHMFCAYFHHKVYEDDYCSNAVGRRGMVNREPI